MDTILHFIAIIIVIIAAVVAVARIFKTSRDRLFFTDYVVSKRDELLKSKKSTSMSPVQINDGPNKENDNLDCDKLSARILVSSFDAPPKFGWSSRL